MERGIPDPHALVEDQYVQTNIRADQLDYYIKQLKDEQDRLLRRIEKLKERHDGLLDEDFKVEEDDKGIPTLEQLEQMKQGFVKNIGGQLIKTNTGIQVLTEEAPALNEGISKKKTTVYANSPTKKNWRRENEEEEENNRSGSKGRQGSPDANYVNINRGNVKGYDDPFETESQKKAREE